MSEIGNNSVDAGRLRSFIERVERLSEEKAAITEDIREIFVEVKSAGYDVKIIRRVLAIRKRDQAEVSEEATVLGLYLSALGMQMDLPL